MAATDNPPLLALLHLGCILPLSPPELCTLLVVVSLRMGRQPFGSLAGSNCNRLLPWQVVELALAVDHLVRRVGRLGVAVDEELAGVVE